VCVHLNIRRRARDIMAAAHERDGDEGTKAPKPRLAIKKMVLENFKSYAGAQHVGPFHKVGVLSLIPSFVCAYACVRVCAYV
jgi:hypothetical protein